MRPATAALITAACIFSGALLGMALRRMLAAGDPSPDAKDSIKLAAGVISLMAALVLGLLVTSAKSSFDDASDAITQGGARVILLDRVLAQYGAETQAVRAEMRRRVAAMIESLWPEARTADPGWKALEGTDGMEAVLGTIRALEPQTEAQRALHAQAQQLGNEILLSRWLQIEQAQTPLPRAFLVILLFWLTMLYLTFGLIAPRNAMVLAVMFVGASSLATAIFLILEMNDPMTGVIRIDGGPMRKALEQLGR